MRRVATHAATLLVLLLAGQAAAAQKVRLVSLGGGQSQRLAPVAIAPDARARCVAAHQCTCRAVALPLTVPLVRALPPGCCLCQVLLGPRRALRQDETSTEASPVAVGGASSPALRGQEGQG